MPAIFSCLGLLTLSAYAHVQGVQNGYPIRNAPTATSDGAFSTSGPCGGALTWGKNGNTQVVSGSSVTLKLKYNGGHADPANEFFLSFACGAPDSDTVLDLPSNKSRAPRLGTTDVMVTDQSLAYALTGVVTASTFPAKCTLSILDQRNWGSCVDLTLVAPASPTPAPTPAAPVSVGGSYTYSIPAAGCDHTQEGALCCCQSSTLVATDNANNTATAVLTTTVSMNPSNCVGTPGTTTQTLLLVPRANVAAIKEAYGTIGGEAFHVVVSDGIATVSNVAQTTPLGICSAVLPRGTGTPGSASTLTLGAALLASVLAFFALP